jgi:hypothetical protein
MKKLIGLLAIGVFFMFPLCANAGIIGNVSLTNYYSGPTGGVTFPSGGGTYYLDYEAKLGIAPVDEAFCVEDATGAVYGSTNTYTLLSIDSGLASFFPTDLNAVSKYLAAAWIADYYYINKKAIDGSEAWKAGAQIAAWEVIFDGPGSFNLSAGGFKSSAYTSEANTIWAARLLSGSGYPLTSSSTWALAVNPEILTTGGPVIKGPYQNYLVHVAEPSVLLLLGCGMVGLVGLGRKFMKQS